MSSRTLSIRHLQPRAEHWDWQLHGLCRGLDPDVFFSREGEGRGGRARRERAAKDICDQCPVERACRDHALSVGERYGVWGGTSEGDRRKLGASEASARPAVPKRQIQISPRYRHSIRR
ncbi:WhiB family transcriptional regulator [Rhodococcus sp. NPDC019627]|uniref:WhiB family transcriptional regulator n=1 Tax=unclassified Rhodococcus (in: high G+C Gram-positive bacteria) TaxID=192944 RepID=UPI0033CD85F3